MARILCVEDNQEFQIYLSSVLKEHTLTFINTINDVLKLIENKRDYYDVILLDVSLPDGNAMRILPKIKDSFLPQIIPIIVLSADDDVLTKVAAFGVGADDYICKPPDPSELKARIDAKLRMIRAITSEKTVMEYKDIFLDTDNMTVHILEKNGNRVRLDLTPYEFKILRLLMGRPGQVFSRDVIIDRVWGIDKYITTRTVDAHVSHLRKKIKNSVVQIETILSTGYKVSTKDNSLE